MTRESLNHPSFTRGPVTEWEAWARLIARAAFAPTRHRVGNRVVDVPRGSFFCTLRDLQSEFMWGSDKKVRLFLDLLESERMIGRKTDAGKTQITICNYEEYQEPGRKKDAKRTQRGRSEDALNNKGTREEAKASSSRGARLPDDWFLPREWGEWALSQGLDEGTVRVEAEKFRNYWTAKTGKDATKLDWFATWRNWCLRAIERTAHSKQRSRADERWQRALDVGARFDEREAASRDVAGGAGSGASVTFLPTGTES